MDGCPPTTKPAPAPSRNLALDVAALPDAWKPSGCARCGGSCPPSADGYCARLGFPATRNYGG